MVYSEIEKRYVLGIKGKPHVRWAVDAKNAASAKNKAKREGLSKVPKSKMIIKEIRSLSRKTPNKVLYRR